MSSVKVCVDTCIISGIARNDISAEHMSALAEIASLHQSQAITLVTSEQAKAEISKIPDDHRAPHEFILRLLSEIPAISATYTDSGLMLMGAGGGTRDKPIFAQLKKLLPDLDDAKHVFQAAENGVQFFLTVDIRSIASRAGQIEQLCSVKVRTPAEFIKGFVS